MRLLVAGGRHWTDKEFVHHVLDRVHETHWITHLIHGDAPGADSFAKDWAEENDIEPDPFPVPDEEWTSLGKKAGPLRNQRMIDEGKPDGAVIFPGRRGTQDMRKRLQKAGITRYEPIPLVVLTEKEARAR